MSNSATRFQGVISTEEQLREVLGTPGRGAVAKAIDRIDEHFAAFIGRSPFMLIGSSDAEGNQDVSPKGDPPGFVRVLDERTLAIPDRPGNKRGDTFSNVIQNPRVALYFLVPGVRETLRVQGRATVVRDEQLRESMTVNGKAPQLAIVVDVDEAFMHCAKCVVRSNLWQPEDWAGTDDLPNLAAALVDQLKLPVTMEELVAGLEQDAPREPVLASGLCSSVAVVIHEHLDEVHRDGENDGAAVLHGDFAQRLQVAKLERHRLGGHDLSRLAEALAGLEFTIGRDDLRPPLTFRLGLARHRTLHGCR